MINDYRGVDSNVHGDGNAGHAQALGDGYLEGIFSKFRAVLQSCIPLGYEDETGFHVGVMSSEENS